MARGVASATMLVGHPQGYTGGAFILYVGISLCAFFASYNYSTTIVAKCTLSFCLLARDTIGLFRITQFVPQPMGCAQTHLWESQSSQFWLRPPRMGRFGSKISKFPCFILENTPIWHPPIMWVFFIDFMFWSFLFSSVPCPFSPRDSSSLPMFQSSWNLKTAHRMRL